MSIRLNVGSRQRRFRVNQDPPQHNAGCSICRVSAEFHGASYPPMKPTTTYPHKFVGFGEWINVDMNPKWEPDVVADGAHMPMFEDGSADVIVFQHVLEHFGLGEADQLLRECSRILQPKGSLLIFIPDVRELAKRWLKREISDYIYTVNLMGAYMGDEADRHKWHYTTEGLYVALNRCGGWRRVVDFDWREIPGADIARDWWILGMEAVK